MTEKDIRRLSRIDLLQLLLELSVENDRLKKSVEALEQELAQRKLNIEKVGSIAETAVLLRTENENLIRKVESLERQLEQRRIDIENSGSLAQAALAVSGVFEAAQAAADLYLANIKAQSEAQSGTHTDFM